MEYDKNKSREVSEEILNERIRQVVEEGFTPNQDDWGYPGKLLKAACCYLWQAKNYVYMGYYEKDSSIRNDYYLSTTPLKEWPWADEWWKPKNPRRDLIKAAALIIAEIERIDRTSETKDG